MNNPGASCRGIEYKMQPTHKNTIQSPRSKLRGILSIKNQGFVTVVHSLEDLKKLNSQEQHLVMKDGDTIVGYLLAMTKYSRHDIPVLIPMFDVFDKLAYKKKLIASSNYIVVGQVCIDKNYRGMGLLDNSYATYKKKLKKNMILLLQK